MNKMTRSFMTNGIEIDKSWKSKSTKFFGHFTLAGVVAHLNLHPFGSVFSSCGK